MNFDNDDKKNNSKKIIKVTISKDATAEMEIEKRVIPKRKISRGKITLNRRACHRGAAFKFKVNRIHYTYEPTKGGEEEKPSQKPKKKDR